MNDAGTLTIYGIGEMYDYTHVDNMTHPNRPSWGGGYKNVVILDGVTSIGSYAFQECGSLQSVILPDSLRSIRTGAFKNNPHTSGIRIPDGVDYIGSGAFDGTKIENIPHNLTEIGNGAFFGSLLTGNIVIPDGVRSIGLSAFSECGRMKSIIIPDSVTSIGKNAFCECRYLENITLPNGLESIEEYVFSECDSLENIVIPDTVNRIDSYAFYGCSNLQSINIPKEVNAFDSTVFEGCIRLKNIFIQDGLSSIGSGAFMHCTGLENITIPSSVTSIGYKAFPSSLTKSVFFHDCDTIINMNNNAFTSSPTIYCYEYSSAEGYAIDKGWNVVLLDNLDINSIITIEIGNDFNMLCGSCILLTPTIFPTLSNTNLAWQSSNPDIITVENGMVTACLPGTAEITATIGTKTDSVFITSYQYARSFNLNLAEEWIVAKDSLQLYVENSIPSGAIIDLLWSSSDTTIATVDNNGLITSKKPGDVRIKAIDRNTGLECYSLIHVCYPVTEINIVQPKEELYTKQELQLTVNISMREQQCVNHLVTFASSNEAIATVDPKSGLIRAIAPGKTTISVKAANNVQDSIKLLVLFDPSGWDVLNLPAGILSIDVGAFYGITCNVVIIPDGCKSIGEYAFANCKNLIYVQIPSSILSYPENAFFECNPNLYIDWKNN